MSLPISTEPPNLQWASSSQEREPLILQWASSSLLIHQISTEPPHLTRATDSPVRFLISREPSNLHSPVSLFYLKRAAESLVNIVNYVVAPILWWASLSLLIYQISSELPHPLWSTASPLSLFIGTATNVISDTPKWRLSHYEVCQLWCLSPYDVCQSWYLRFVAYDVCRIIIFVAESLYLYWVTASPVTVSLIISFEPLSLHWAF